MMMGKPGMGSMNKPPKGPSMGSMGSDEESEDMGEESDDKSAKLLALQNLMSAISDLAGDDMKPYIDNMVQQAHLGHEQEEGDSVGVDEAQDSMQGSPKPGVDVMIGMGGKPPMEDDEEDESKPKGFIALLAKKMKK